MTAPSHRDALPVLVHGDIHLREVQPDDAAAFAELFARPEVATHLSPPPDSINAFADWIQLSLTRRVDGRAICYTMLDATNNHVAGLFMCLRATRDDSEAEIGIALAPHLWGTGVFLPAAGLYVNCLFAQWPIDRVIGKTLARNHRAIGAMRKLGATIIDQTTRNGETEFVWAITREARPRATSWSSPPEG